jgi:uncharacterized RDD family membrane protein YckC
MSEQRGVYYAPADCLGVWRRIGIDVIDAMLASIFALLLSIPFAVLFRNALPIVVIWPGVWITYFVFLKGTYRTLGYVIARARIVDLQGTRPSYFTLFARLAFVILGPFNFFIDLTWLSDDPSRQALRDKFTHTYVIRDAAQPEGAGPIVYSVCTVGGGTLLFADVRRSSSSNAHSSSGDMPYVSGSAAS